MSWKNRKKKRKRTMEKAKRDLERLKAKLGSDEALGWQAKRILRLYAQGLSDYQRGEFRKPWRANYRDAIETYGSEFASSDGLSTRTVYWLMFTIQFRGGKDSEKAYRSLMEFWLLARWIAPKAVEQLMLGKEKDERGKRFIESLDRELARLSEGEDKAERPEQKARVARRFGRAIAGYRSLTKSREAGARVLLSRLNDSREVRV